MDASIFFLAYSESHESERFIDEIDLKYKWHLGLNHIERKGLTNWRKERLFGSIDYLVKFSCNSYLQDNMTKPLYFVRQMERDH